MKFHEAIEAMEEGKRIKRRCWQDGSILFFNSTGNLCHVDGDYIKLDFLQRGMFEATDWEIVEVKKTLSDKICDIDGDRVLYIQDVKEAINELLSNLYKDETKMDTQRRIKEIFGERLIE